LDPIIVGSRHEEKSMQAMKVVGVLFIAGFGPIHSDVSETRKLYCDVLGMSMKEDKGGYVYTAALAGAKHFALWPLSLAAESCFGKHTWPASIPVPQGWLEFEVETVEKATAQLESQGYQTLINNKKEPWGQTQIQVRRLGGRQP
jgi:catechol 2,3-dioxygenase-like lactoylglutathione lyase family enzyme